MSPQFDSLSAANSLALQSDAKINALLESFESGWLATSQYLKDFAIRESIESQPRCLVELVRADIDRRYSLNAEVDLPKYFQFFPVLNSIANLASEVAFEDFRSRKSRGLSIRVDRWSWVKDIRQADWFKLLENSGSSDRVWNRVQRDASPVSSPNAEPRIGELFGDFQLLSWLGTGAFSKVYLATQSSLAGRYIALKVVRRSLDEPAHLARLQHTGIVPLYSVHRIGNYTALCMPYYGSATLADWLREQSVASERNGQSLVTTVQAALEKLTHVDESTEDELPSCSFPEELSRIRVWNSAALQPLKKISSLDARNFLLWFARNVASALAHAHDRGIIHGDLKPANILLRNDGEPALIDFNLAQENGSNPSAWTGGTLPYMSPEQLQMLIGKQFSANTTSDIFSFGIILFEVLENRLPFPAPLSAAEVDVEAAIATRKLNPQVTNPNATAGLRSILSKCLEFDPQKRYANASSLLEDLLKESSNLRLVHARESMLRSRLPKLIRRYPRVFSGVPIAAISLMIILLLAISAYNYWRNAMRLTAISDLASFETVSAQVIPHLISEKQQLAAAVDDAVQCVDQFIGNHTEKEHQPSTLAWLEPAEQNLARERTFAFCLASSALACESWNTLDAATQEKVRRLLNFCESLETNFERSPVLANLRHVVEGGAPDTATGLRVVDFTTLRPVEELLLARGDVLQDRSRLALKRIARLADLPRGNNSLFGHLYWLTAGDAQSRLGQSEAALLSYELAIAAAPDAAAGYVHRALMRLQGRDYEAAEVDLTAAIEISPKVAGYYVDRALVRERRANFEGALGDLNSALELSPDSNRIVLIRARVNQRLGDNEATRDDLKHGMLSVPKTVEDWISRALAQLPRFPDRAIRDLQAAETLEPGSLVVLQNIAHVQAEHLQDTSVAIATLNRILVADSSRETARGGRCVLYARVGRTVDALQDIDTLLKQNERPAPAILYQIGCAHALLSGDNDSSSELAVQFIAKALNLGYGAELIASDSDLDNIRQFPTFVALATTAKLSLELEANK